MNEKFLIAIDPGSAGGIAWQFKMGSVLATKMPETPGDIRDQFEAFHQTYGQDVIVFMEKVGGHQGKAHPGAAMFNFGHGVGVLQGLILAYRWELRLVTPQQWQKRLGMSKNGDSDTLWKNRLKARAQEIFPAVPKITLSTADALLLLDYGRKEIAKNG